MYNKITLRKGMSSINAGKKLMEILWIYIKLHSINYKLNKTIYIGYEFK